MAMSMRTRGGAGGGNRGRSVRPIYEEFKPVFEWKYEQEANILLYHLPGFVKEQIRILAESKGVLRVRGECFVGGNNWKRFQEEVLVPEDCNMSEIRAKFEGGILRIIMPKKIKTSNAPDLIKTPTKPEYGHTSTNAPDPVKNPTKPEHDHTGTNAPDLVQNPTKPVYDHTSTNAPDLVKNPTKPVYDSTSANAPDPIGNIARPVYDHTSANAPDPVGNIARPMYDRTSANAPYPVRNIAKPVYDHTSTNAPGPIRNPTKPYQTDTNAPDSIKTTHTVPTPANKAQPSALRDHETPKASMPKPQTRPQQAQNMEEDRKYKKPFDYDNENDKEKNEVYEEKEKKGANYGFEDYKKATNKTQLVPKNFKEDRQLLANMGVAILVIVGLGAYVSYSFGCPT